MHAASRIPKARQKKADGNAMKIALCSPGLTRQAEMSRTVGLDFLARLIRQKYGKTAEFFLIHERDVMKLSPGVVDFLLVSFTGTEAALIYARAVKCKKPPVFTAFGGPGMMFPAAFREMADAIMIGRGEDAIFRCLEGDYSGMMRPDSTLATDSVHICTPSLLSPGQESVGCKFRCGFCSYSWMNTFGCASARASSFYTSAHKDVTKADTKADVFQMLPEKPQAPAREMMFKDLNFAMLSTTGFKRPVSGIDILTDLDRILVRKPISFALVRSVLMRLANEAKFAFPGLYTAKVYSIACYPWNSIPCDLSRLNEIFKSIEFPPGIRIKFDLKISHFSPQVTTPLECCAVSTANARDLARAPEWPNNGAFLHIDRLTIPGPINAIQQTILQRAADPDAVRLVLRCKTVSDYERYFADLMDWQAAKPAPWIRRNNAVYERIQRFYHDLYAHSDLRPPIPSGYAPDASEPDRYGLPVADFGCGIERAPKKKSGVSMRLFSSL